TGDVARMDEDGYFYIVDRLKEIIIAGGFNIYPREVEEVLYEHPAVKEAAVIGVPDPYRGETVKAFVVLKPGARATADDIIAFCREHLARYKVPTHVEFRDDLPKSLVGKVLRRGLAEEEAAQRAPTGPGTPGAAGLRPPPGFPARRGRQARGAVGAPPASCCSASWIMRRTMCPPTAPFRRDGTSPR